MYFQKVLKGIAGLSRPEVDLILEKKGIVCNWWRNRGLISESEILAELTMDKLVHHLDHYDNKLPSAHPWATVGKNYGDVSAFISTSAGTMQSDGRKKRNIPHAPFMTALRFATSKFKSQSWVFYVYPEGEYYDGSAVLADFSAGRKPSALDRDNLYGTFIPFEPEILAACICIGAYTQRMRWSLDKLISSMGEGLPIIPLSLAKEMIIQS